jgi:hypothetical protein
MRYRLALFVVCCCGLIPGGNSAGQESPSRSFNGYDGASLDPRANSPYLANIYGSAIEVLPRQDTCSRTFYIAGIITMAENGQSGTFDGHMSRCTNPELFKCEHLINYEVSAQGDVKRTATGYSLQLRYTHEHWNVDSCKKEREERRTEQLELYELPPAPPPPTTGDNIRTIYNRGVRTFWRGVWTMGGQVPH